MALGDLFTDSHWFCMMLDTISISVTSYRKRHTDINFSLSVDKWGVGIVMLNEILCLVTFKIHDAGSINLLL